MADVVLNNIVKTYNKGEVKAVNDVSFEVNKGELFGLIEQTEQENKHFPHTYYAIASR